MKNHLKVLLVLFPLFSGIIGCDWQAQADAKNKTLPPEAIDSRNQDSLNAPGVRKQASSAQVSSTQAGSAQAGSAQASSTQAGSAQAGSTQASSAQASSTPASSAQASSAQVSSTKPSSTPASSKATNMEDNEPALITWLYANSCKLWPGIASVLAFLLVLCFFKDNEFIRKITVLLTGGFRKNSAVNHASNNSDKVIDHEHPGNNLMPQTPPNPDKKIRTDEVSVAHPETFSNVSYLNKRKGPGENEWYVLGASSIGKSHISSKIPCQDNHLSKISDDWGIAIVCDGAGSAKNSHHGSAFVSKKAYEVFESQLSGYLKQNCLPDADEWQRMAKESLTEVYTSLEEFSRKNNYDLRSLACTIIVVVFTPYGLLSTHIGDGRAGYCDEQGTWTSLINPHKGAEANETIFINSPAWLGTKPLIMSSNIHVPESNIVHGAVRAFMLMSDGCEHHTYECSKITQAGNRTVWSDPNLPSEKFFGALASQINEMQRNGLDYQMVMKHWTKLIEEGTTGLKEEQDDKTLIFGVRISNV